MAPLTIVVVDDDMSIGAMLEIVLRLDGHTVHLAIDGESGFELVQSVLPDIVVIDVMMPGLDGRELARRLRAHPATQDVGIVFFSALEADGDIWKGWSVGADSYVPKSAELDRLVDEIHRVAAERSLGIA